MNVNQEICSGKHGDAGFLARPLLQQKLGEIATVSLASQIVGINYGLSASPLLAAQKPFELMWVLGWLELPVRHHQPDQVIHFRGAVDTEVDVCTPAGR